MLRIIQIKKEKNSYASIVYEQDIQLKVKIPKICRVKAIAKFEFLVEVSFYVFKNISTLQKDKRSNLFRKTKPRVLKKVQKSVQG